MKKNFAVLQMPDRICECTDMVFDYVQEKVFLLALYHHMQSGENTVTLHMKQLMTFLGYSSIEQLMKVQRSVQNFDNALEKAIQKENKHVQSLDEFHVDFYPVESFEHDVASLVKEMTFNTYDTLIVMFNDNIDTMISESKSSITLVLDDMVGLDTKKSVCLYRTLFYQLRKTENESVSFYQDVDLSGSVLAVFSTDELKHALGLKKSAYILNDGGGSGKIQTKHSDMLRKAVLPAIRQIQQRTGVYFNVEQMPPGSRYSIHSHSYSYSGQKVYTFAIKIRHRDKKD